MSIATNGECHSDQRGEVFSAGGGFDTIQQNIDNFDPRVRQWKGSAMRGVAVGAGLVCGILVAGRRI